MKLSVRAEKAVESYVKSLGIPRTHLKDWSVIMNCSDLEKLFVAGWRSAKREKKGGDEVKSEVPTYCKGCSFKCQASDCDCKCHDRIREYWRKEKVTK